MANSMATLATRVSAQFSDLSVKVLTDRGQVTLEVMSSDYVQVCTALRDKLGFELLMDLCGVDYAAYGEAEWNTDTLTGGGVSRGAERDAGCPAAHGYRPHGRFAVVLQLLSVSTNQRLRVRVFAADDELPVVDSVTAIWSSADWYEREAFDLYGLLFDGHTDLRRILTDYGFIGHPFRKDFPLSGNMEMRYDPIQQRVVYEPVSIEPRTLVPRVIRHDHRLVGQGVEPDGAEPKA